MAVAHAEHRAWSGGQKKAPAQPKLRGGQVTPAMTYFLA